MHNVFEFLNRHQNVSRETFLRLEAYHSLLLKWQPKINLVGPDTINDAWDRHFLDSLQLIKFIGNNVDKTIIDLGSGAGFPGMVLAAAGYRNIHLIESDTRKVAFLREVARATESKVEIHHARIEDVSIEKVDIIVSRACSSLDKLLSYSIQNVSRETFCLFHKGKNYTKEIEDAKLHWQFDHSATPSIVGVDGVILQLSNLRKQTNDTKKPSPNT